MSTQTVLTASTKANKRKSDAFDAQTSHKKARTARHIAAQSLVEKILASSDAFSIPSSDNIRASLVGLAEYTKALESEAQEAKEGRVVARKTPEELEAFAENVRRAVRSGIKKQMAWKPSCKTGTAKWSYDGVCPDPDVFALLMGMNTRPSWKMKKIIKDDFDKLLGEAIRASVSYATLSIMSKSM